MEKGYSVKSYHWCGARTRTKYPSIALSRPHADARVANKARTKEPPNHQRYTARNHVTWVLLLCLAELWIRSRQSSINMLRLCETLDRGLLFLCLQVYEVLSMSTVVLLAGMQRMRAMAETRKQMDSYIDYTTRRKCTTWYCVCARNAIRRGI